MFALSGRAGVRQPVEDGAVANQQLKHTIRVAVATGKSSHQVWWSRYQEDILACTDRLFGVGGEYTVLLHDEILGGPQPLPDNLVECLTSRWVASHGPAPSGQQASKQSSWDRPGLLVDSAAVEESCTSPFQRASLLATRAPHSGDWLLALPITACGLRLEDEAVRIAVALRLGSELGSSHTCRCGSLVEATGVHGLVASKPLAEL